jgi:hypothetical protein
VLLLQNIRVDNVFCTYHLPCNAHLDTPVRKARAEDIWSRSHIIPHFLSPVVSLTLTGRYRPHW